MRKIHKNKFTQEFWSTSVLKTIRHEGKKLKKTQINVKIIFAHELKELILLKWSCFSKQYASSVQSLSKFNSIFLYRNRTKNFKICMELQKNSNSESNHDKGEKKTKLKTVCFKIWNSITKLW